MNSFVEASLRQFFEKRSDLFGERSVYLTFEMDPKCAADGGYNSTMIFGRILYQRGNEKCHSKSLILKQMLPQIKSNSDAEIFEIVNETFFYTHIIPFFNSYRNTDSLFAEFFDSNFRINVAQKEMLMIFENLRASGFKAADRHSFLDYEHLSLMLRKLGNFHAYSYKAKFAEPVRFRNLCDLRVNTYATFIRKYSHLFSKIAKYGLRGLRQDTQYSKPLSKIEKIVSSLTKFIDELLITIDKADPLYVLCHGDYLGGNVMFKYVNGKPVDLKMIDMARCVLASPIIDLAHVLYLNADQRMRNEHWDDLLDEYHAGLREYFHDIKVPTKNEIIAQFSRKSLIGYTVAALFIGCLIASDHNLESFDDRLPSEYKDVIFENIPHDELYLIMRDIGDSLTANALTDILKDIIDRGFI